MDTIKDTINKELQKMSSQGHSTTIFSNNENKTAVLVDKETHFEISAFNEEMSESNQLKEIANIKLAFPTLPTGFYAVLLDRVRELKISDQRLKFAVAHVIDNCEYPTPTLAQFIGFDKKIELLNYAQYTRKNDELHGQVAKYYKSIRVHGFEKPFWAKIEDIQRYNLELFNK